MYDKIIGSLLVGSWANCMLFMLEILQVISYYKNYKNDTPLLRVTVAICFALDTICTVANNIGVYKYTITNWGVVEYLSQQEWPLPLYVFCTSLCAAVVQTFLARRYYALSKQKLILIPLTFLVFTSFAGATATGIMLILASSLSDRGILKVPVIIWFVLSSVVDCALAGLLVWQLQTSRTGFRGTSSLINRLSSVALQSGSYTSAIALTVLLLFLADPQSNIATGLCQCLGRVYTLTLVHNLLIRKKIREDSRGGTSTTGGMESVALSGIRIQTDRSVLVDPPKTPAALNGKVTGEEGFDANSKGYPLA